MNVTLYKAFPDVYRQSMGIYANHLYEALSHVVQHGDRLVKFLPKNISLKPPLRYWAQYVEYQLKAPFVQGDINHVIDHSYGHLLHTLDKKRTVITFHDAIGLKIQDGTLGNIERDNHIRLIQHYNVSGLRKAAAVICVSRASQKDFIKYVNYPLEQTVVIPEGVDSSFFKKHYNDPYKCLGLKKGHYILHVGHTHFYKNIPAVFQVLSILCQFLGGNIKLLKVGGAFTPEQENLAANLGIKEKIIHFGVVNNEILSNIYHCADVLLFPSLYEGFGFPVLEAMACGTPVVASNRGSLPEVVGDAGILIDPTDYETMAKSIVSIINNFDLRSKLSIAGIKRAQQFTWEKTAKKTVEVYRHVHKNIGR